MKVEILSIKWTTTNAWVTIYFFFIIQKKKK